MGEFSSAQETAERVSFNLSFHRSTGNPRFGPSGLLDDENIDHAYIPGQYRAAGLRDHLLSWDAEDDWLYTFFRLAVGYTVHQMLEWFQLDGRPLVNPHDPEVRAVRAEIVTEFVDKLYALRQARPGSCLSGSESNEGVMDKVEGD